MLTLVDVWEGALDVNETIFYQAGVAGIIIRINDMNGGHHMDTNFFTQWAQASNFLRAPYFVYNPWATGAENWAWLSSHLDGVPGVTRVFVDVEVSKPDYPAVTYAAQLQAFLDLAQRKYLTAIYTGAWFLSRLSTWPGGDYWWARYPYALCPQGDRQVWTWEKWHQTSAIYGYHPDPTHLCPGNPILWQASGDKLILPGTANRPIDLNLWNNDLYALEQWWGAPAPVPPIGQLDILWREAGLHGWNLQP